MRSSANFIQPLFDQLPERLKKTTTRPTPTKKRSAPVQSQASKAGTATLPGRPNLQDAVPQRRSDEMVRPGLIRREARGPPQRTSSFDTVGFQHGSLAGQNFTNLRDILPMDMSLAGTSPESNSTQGTAIHSHTQGFQPGQPAGGPVNPLYNLDAMMFPSGDPLAYPNQPMVDSHHPGGQGSGAGAGQSPEMQFYIPSNMYDGSIEGQLMEPIPSYLMQQGQAQGQGQAQHHGLDPTGQLYDTSNLLAMQHGGSHGHQHHQQAQHQQHHQQPGGSMEGMMADPNFQGPNWDDILGGSGYR